MASSQSTLGASEWVEALRSLACIRKRCSLIRDAARSDQLQHFRVNESKMNDVVTFVQDIIDRDYPSFDDVPFHSRFRQFEAGGIDRVGGLVAEWDCDSLEKARRLIDLVTTSVLLDAGAGNVWRYREPNTGFEASRSEGLGVASFHMFKSGAFSGDPEKNPYRADSVGLRTLADDSVRKMFQVDDTSNPLVGCEGRTQVWITPYELLRRIPSLEERCKM